MWSSRGNAPANEMVLKDDRPRGAPRPFARPDTGERRASTGRPGPNRPRPVGRPGGGSLPPCGEEGWKREEVIDALNVALIVGGSIVIPHVRRAFARMREIEGLKP